MSSSIRLLRAINPENICICYMPIQDKKRWGVDGFYYYTSPEKLELLRNTTTVVETEKNGIKVYELPTLDSEPIVYTDDDCHSAFDILTADTAFCIDRNYYGKSRVWKRDEKKLKSIFHNDTTQSILHTLENWNRPAAFIETAYELDGWFCKKRYYRGTRHYYLAFTKQHAIRILHDLIDVKRIVKDNRNPDDIDQVLHHIRTFTDQFVDGETILELAW